MQILVECRVFESIVGDMVPKLRQDVGVAIQRIAQSGKMVAGGVLADTRGVFLLLNINQPEEFLTLFGSEVYENCHITMHPITPFEKLAEFFEREAKKQSG